MVVIKSIIIRMLAGLLGVFMLIGAPSKAVPDGDLPQAPENCRLAVNIISDVHMEGNNNYRRGVYEQILRNMKEYAPADAMAALGDNVMNGFFFESVFFYGLTKTIDPADRYIVVAGNHDTGNGAGDFEKMTQWYLDFYNAYNADAPIEKVYYLTHVNGYAFIVLGSEEDTSSLGRYSKEQMDWLEQTLAREYEPGKPVFILSHYPYDHSTSENDRRLREICSRYENIFFFSGHLHRAGVSVTQPWDGFTAVNLPRVTECDEEDGDTRYYTGWGVRLFVTDGEVILHVSDFYRARNERTYTFSLTDGTYTLEPEEPQIPVIPPIIF